MSALIDFRNAYSAMLIAAERLRAELDPDCTAKVPHDIRSIQAAVSTEFGIPLRRLLSRSRDEETAIARQVATLLCRERTRHSLSAIDDAFYRRKGTSAHNIRAITERSKREPRIQDAVMAARLRIETLPSH